MNPTLARVLIATTAALTSITLACTGSSSSGGCDPTFDDQCICRSSEDVACQPGVDLDCACELADDANNGGDPNNGDPNNGGGNNATNNGGANNDPLPTGDATLTFVATYGDGARLQFEANPRGFIPAFEGQGDLVVMLCRPADPTCLDPVWINRLDKTDPTVWTAGGTDPDPIQTGFGPTLTVSDLPAGDFLLMVVEDSQASQARGLDWKSDAITERAWGGVASVADHLLTDVEASLGTNPPPAPRPITLVDGQTLDLGKLLLAHFHEEDISPAPQPETGLLVVGTPSRGGVRLIDLNGFDLIPAHQQGDITVYDYVLLGPDDLEVPGLVCNVIPGPGKNVWVMFGAQSDDVAGYAALFDPISRQQVTHNLVTFPADGNDAPPCKARFHTADGRQLLFAVASGGSNDVPRAGLWYADVTNLQTAPVTATQAHTDPLFDEELTGVEVHGDELLLGSFAELPGCNGRDERRSCVFRATFAADGAPTPLRDANADYLTWRTNDFDASVPRPGVGEQRCSGTSQGVHTFGMKVARFHKTDHDLLFVGNCLEIATFDLTTGEALDYDAISPGRQGFDASLYGAGFYDLQLSPDGQTLYAAPANKSFSPFFAASSVGEIQTDRHTLLAIDLSDAVPGQLPAADPRFGTRDQDAFHGLPDEVIGQLLPTPASDPGIDLRAFYLRRYLYGWSAALAGAVPIAVPTGPTIAVARNTVWMRGAGSTESGESGLSVGGNLQVIDLHAQEVALFPRADRAFHGPFTDLERFHTGYDLTPESELEVETAGMVFVER